MVVLVRLPARLDESNASQISADLIAAARHHPNVLIADMSSTKSCDWAGAAALARAFSQATRRGTELRLVVTSESVRRVLSLNGLDSLLPIFENVEAASTTSPGALLQSL
ncbi:MAG: STAS domain-containing protein [Actinobacteria bacterium]|nr:STAS domain-containing protein [Actinomycetota bacterium]